MDDIPQDDQKIQRQRRTTLLIALGAVALILPLLILLYLRINNNPEETAQGNAAPGFAHRGTQLDRIKAAATPAPAASTLPPSPPPSAGRQSPIRSAGGDSLGFIKTDSEYYQEPAPKPAAPPAASPKKTAPAEPARRKPARVEKKQFAQPKLQLTGSSGTFYKVNSRSADKPFNHSRSQPAGSPSEAPPGINALLKNLPTGGGTPGAPDINSLLKDLPADATQKTR
ncbi:MAG: hypothetical protein WC881_03830 [Elusimicrobiota bacterium]|jgi:hypothetical protein